MVRASVIIPLFNKGRYIVRTIDSVLTQTFPDFEIIVIDDGSTDDGPALVRHIQDPRIRLIQQENAGAAVARNTGVSHARSDLIAFLDADDEWSPLHLETLGRLQEKFPGAGCYATACKMIDWDGAVRYLHYRSIPPAPWEGIIPNYFQAAARSEPVVTATSSGVRKAVFQEVGGFPPGRKWGEDPDLWLRIALKYPVAFSWAGEALWHNDAEGRVTDSLPYLERQLFVSRALAEIRNNRVKPEHLPYLKEYIVKIELLRALWNIKAGFPERAREILKECETELFRWRKIRLHMFSYLPVPVFRFLWGVLRSLRSTVFGHDYRSDPWLK
jgi:glycosyltransferase involved in cell wall biosynthesis